MAAGGIYDQVGGGFHRYSVDAHWLVPHFEKMLYDQALLTRAYVHAWLVTGEPRYRRVVEETVGYVLRDLRHETGGFFSAEDADSEGVEGKFYVWSLAELEELVRRRPARAGPPLRRDRPGQLRGPAHRVPRQHPPRGRPDRGPARRRSRGCSPSCSRRARTGCGRGSTTRCCSGGTRCSCARSPRRPTRSTGADWMDAARTNARFLLARAPPRRRAAAPLVAGRPRQPPRLRRGLRRAPRGAAHAGRGRRRRLARRRPHRRRRPGRAVRRRRPRRLLHHRHRRRGAHRPAQGLPGQRDPVGELTGRRRPAAPRRAHRRHALPPSAPSAGWRPWRRCSASTRPRSRSCSRPTNGSCTRRSRWRWSANPTIPAASRCVAELRRRVLPASVRVAAAPGTGDGPHPAARRPPDRRRARHRLRLRALRLPAPRHRPRRAPRPARRRPRGAHLRP